MATDEEWVNDVRRWYFGGHPPEGELATDGSSAQDEHAIGYEAGLPAFPGSRWPDALVAGTN